MKLPLSWLKDYVDIDCTAEELKDKLFSCGFEVEEMEYVAKNINRIVTSKILSIDKHPNADKLSVTQVDAGCHGQLQIITSAKNISVGDVVPVALDGSTLFNGETIKTGELRGVPSFGMFCSGEELGINDDWYKGASVNGILILDKDFPLGVEVKELLEIEDIMFDINVTANRPDCQSILGLAREVAAVLNKPLKMPDLTYSVNKNISTTKTIKVEDKAYDLCPRYIAHLVKNVKIEESPLWMKRRLFRMGIRSINNIVDITNFVLMEIGQPMHAFDLTELEGNSIIIRRANDGEKIVTLDEKEFLLNQSNLVICDSTKPVALAGIMGGLNSGIKDSTCDVVFESAKFARDNIRKTSRALKQRSDSSSRFEKGVDNLSVEYGIKRALNLISTLNCGEIACDGYDLYDVKPTQKVILTKISKINAVLGLDIQSSYIEKVLLSLGFGVVIKGDDISVTVPLYREDVEDYPDIAEEIIREYGYDHIQSTLLKTSSITNGGKNEAQKKIDDLKNLLVGYGFNEIITYSFVSEKDFEIYGLDKSNVVKILNPISEELAVMRTSLLPSIINIVSKNVNRKNKEGRLFEFAKVYNPLIKDVNGLPEENNVLSFAIFGDIEDFFTAKGVVEGLLNTFNYSKKVEYVKATENYMHPTRSADVIIDGIKVGYFGQVKPSICNELDIDRPVYAGEIYYEELKNLFVDKIVFKEISKYPHVERDLAVTVDESVLVGDIIDEIKNSDKKYLENVSLFDVYRSEQLGANKKSLAFNLIYVSYEKTLSVEEIEHSIKKILINLKDKFGAELR